jgi:hypothetical protein
MLKKLLMNKRAISTVLSHLLLTVIAVALMSIVISATYVITTNMRENMAERAIVEDVWFNNANGTLNLYVHNIGKTSIQIQTVYINHVNQSFNEPFHLDLDEHSWLNVAFEWKSGDVYYVDLVTSRGTHIAEYYKAP